MMKQNTPKIAGRILGLYIYKLPFFLLLFSFFFPAQAGNETIYLADGAILVASENAVISGQTSFSSINIDHQRSTRTVASKKSQGTTAKIFILKKISTENERKISQVSKKIKKNVSQKTVKSPNSDELIAGTFHQLNSTADFSFFLKYWIKSQFQPSLDLFLFSTESTTNSFQFVIENRISISFSIRPPPFLI